MYIKKKTNLSVVPSNENDNSINLWQLQLIILFFFCFFNKDLGDAIVQQS